MEKDIEKLLKEQQEEIERLKKQARKQKLWNIVFALRNQ